MSGGVSGVRTTCCVRGVSSKTCCESGDVCSYRADGRSVSGSDVSCGNAHAGCGNEMGCNCESENACDHGDGKRSGGVRYDNLQQCDHIYHS